ncbi:MAG: T9SS type A sorting domain-containing protein [Bacteroidia bacterium]
MKKITMLAFFSLTMIALNAQHGPVVPIDSIQYVNPQDLQNGEDDPANFQYGDTVTIEGVVSFDPGWYGLSTSRSRKSTWIQTEAPMPFGGIEVMAEPSAFQGYDLDQLMTEVKFMDNMVRGLTVKVTGQVREFEGSTQLHVMPVESEITNLTPVNLQPELLEIEDFMQNDGSGNQVEQMETAEPWEGVLVEFRNVKVVDITASGSRWFWSLQDSKGNRIGVRDVSGWFRNDNTSDNPTPAGYNFTPPVEGSEISYVRGIIVQTENFGYQIGPRDTNDIGPVVSPPFIESVTRTPTVPSATDAIEVTGRISDENDAVASATLHYRVGTTGSISEVAMVEIQDSIYRAQIPAQADGAYIYYWVSSEDADGGSSFVPDSLQTGYVVQVLDNGIRSIRNIQRTPSGGGSSIWEDDTLRNINVRGVVIATLNDLGLTTIQDGTTPFSGIFLRARAGDGIVNLHRGDSIQITSAIVTEIFNVTHLENITYEVISHGNELPAAVTGLPMDSVRTGANAYSEAYEGMLVQFDNVFIATNNADSPSYFGEWAIGEQLNTTAGLRVDDYSTRIADNFAEDSLTRNQFLPYLRGIMYFSFSNWKILPRDLNDIGSFEQRAVISFEPGVLSVSEDTGSIELAITLTNTQSVPVEVEVNVAPGTTASEGTDFSITPKTITFPPNSFTYTTFTLSITDNTTMDPNDTIILELENTANIADIDVKEKTIIVIDDEQTGLKEQPASFAARIFPNPASYHFRLSLNSDRPASYLISIQDIAGRTIESSEREVAKGENNIIFNINGLHQGIYFLRIQNEKDVEMITFSVVK